MTSNNNKQVYSTEDEEGVVVSDDDDDDEENNNNVRTSSRRDHAESQSSYIEFRKRRARGILYKLNPMSDSLKIKVTAYVEDGAMQKDLRYAREIFGLINTAGRKDFAYVWESPWIEEHIRDTAKRKRVESQHRSMAVKNFLKASSTHDTDNIEKFITNVDRLTEWEDKYESREDVKTISRVVQSYERVAVRQILNFCESVPGEQYHNVRALIHGLQSSTAELAGISPIANALRRADVSFDLFAAMVASEINWADCTNGSRNISIFANKQLEYKKDTALTKLIHGLDSILISSSRNPIPTDTVGMPLMDINFNICISHGVLVVGQKSRSATYVLDIVDDGKEGRHQDIDLSGVKTVEIIQTFSDEDLRRNSLQGNNTMKTLSANSKKNDKRQTQRKAHSLFADLT